MKKSAILTVIFMFAAVGGTFAQSAAKSKKTEKANSTGAASANIVSKNASPLELARATLKIYGGDKFKDMKTLVVRGTADVSGSPTTTFPATFATIYAGEKYRLEISNPFQPFKQIFDGQTTSSSVRGFELPPLNRLGLPLLPKIDAKDFAVSALPEKNKKKSGFRITAPEGFYTDFVIDEKTGMIKSYESSYEINGRNVTTSVEIDRVREVDGVKVPELYAQRFDIGQFVVYVDFKAKEILVNSPVADELFSVNK